MKREKPKPERRWMLHDGEVFLHDTYDSRQQARIREQILFGYYSVHPVYVVPADIWDKVPAKYKGAA